MEGVRKRDAQGVRVVPHRPFLARSLTMVSAIYIARRHGADSVSPKAPGPLKVRSMRSARKLFYRKRPACLLTHARLDHPLWSLFYRNQQALARSQKIMLASAMGRQGWGRRRADGKDERRSEEVEEETRRAGRRRR